MIKQITKEDILNELSTPIEDKVTPYHNLSYAEQIQKKKDYLLGSEVLQSFSQCLEDNITKQKEYAPAWYRDIHLNYRGNGVLDPPCPLEGIIECDKDYRQGYRNKVEFTIGRKFKDIGEKGEICIGFNHGNLAKGIHYVG